MSKYWFDRVILDDSLEHEFKHFWEPYDQVQIKYDNENGEAEIDDSQNEQQSVLFTVPFVFRTFTVVKHFDSKYAEHHDGQLNQVSEHKEAEQYSLDAHLLLQSYQY